MFSNIYCVMLPTIPTLHSRQSHIRSRAYQLWEQRQRPTNDDWSDWFQAERQDNTPYEPQAKYHGRRKNKYIPSVGAGVYLVLIHLLVLGVTSYICWHFGIAMSPNLIDTARWQYLLFMIGFFALPPGLVVASTCSSCSRIRKVLAE